MPPVVVHGAGSDVVPEQNPEVIACLASMYDVRYRPSVACDLPLNLQLLAHSVSTFLLSLRSGGSGNRVLFKTVLCDAFLR